MLEITACTAPLQPPQKRCATFVITHSMTRYKRSEEEKHGKTKSVGRMKKIRV